MSATKVFQFIGIDCTLVKESYASKNKEVRLALRVVAADSQHNIDNGVMEGEPVAMASLNMPTTPLKENEVVIKSYGENQGLLTILANAGVVKRTGRFVFTGMETSEIALCLI